MQFVDGELVNNDKLPCPLLPLGRFANPRGTEESEMDSGGQREVLGSLLLLPRICGA
jgi:hypothetical protein